jgi:hypothetical protein
VVPDGPRAQVPELQRRRNLEILLAVLGQGQGLLASGVNLRWTTACCPGSIFVGLCG